MKRQWADGLTLAILALGLSVAGCQPSVEPKPKVDLTEPKQIVDPLSGGRPELGGALPPHANQELGLTKEQEQELTLLNQEVNARLGKLLTPEQAKRLEQLPQPSPGSGPPPKFELGSVLPPHARPALGLTREQEKDLNALEKDVKDRLAKLLTAEQIKRLERLSPPAATGVAPKGGKAPQFELGWVLPPQIRAVLGLTKEQEQELAVLEKEVKERLSKLLTVEQKAQLDRLPPPSPFGGPPPRFELGWLLPPHARPVLGLTKEQELELASMEKDVKERLSKLLTAEQLKRLER